MLRVRILSRASDGLLGLKMDERPGVFLTIENHKKTMEKP